MYVTIHTDASVKNGKGAWAAVVSTNETNTTISDIIPVKGNISINYAELYAIHKALLFVKQNYEATNVLIFTDSMCVIRWLSIGPPKKRGPNKELQQIVVSQLSEYTHSIEYTKAHIGNTLNDLCDKIAKQTREDK